jgi:hypothetical protein
MKTKTPDYIKNTYTPTEYSQPIQNPKDHITREILYAFKEDPHIVLSQANEERKKHRQEVIKMLNDEDNYITIRYTDDNNIQGAVEEFKKKQRQAQREEKKRERMNKRNKAIETSLTAIATRKNNKGEGIRQGTSVRKTRRNYKKSYKTNRKHRKRTHRRR